MLQALANTHTHTHTNTHTQTIQTMFYDPKPIDRNAHSKTMVYYEPDKLAINYGTNK